MESKQRRPTPQSNGTESLRTFSTTQYHSAAINPLFPMAAPPPLQPAIHPADAIVRPQSCNNNFHSSPGYWISDAADYEGEEDEEEALYSSSTLPKPPPPLKGILKNTAVAAYPAAGAAAVTNSSASTEHLFAEMDVLPFDNVPPCDDCVAKAKIKGGGLAFLRTPIITSSPTSLINFHS